jgi:hypothetical protein
LISLMAEEFLLLVVAAGKKRHLTFLLSRAWLKIKLNYVGIYLCIVNCFCQQ